MTIVSCGIFPQGIFITGDSRGISLSEDGEFGEYYDDIQKVYLIEPYIIGVAGDSFFASLTLLQINNSLKQLGNKFSVPFADRKNQIIKLLANSYELISNSYNKQSKLSFLVATINENYQDNEHYSSQSTNINQKIVKIKAGVDDFSSLFAEDNLFVDNGFLISVSFPGCIVNEKKSYGILSIGSGEVFNNIVSDYEAFIHNGMYTSYKDLFSNVIINDEGEGEGEGEGEFKLIDDISGAEIDELWASISFRIGSFFFNNNDFTFNDYLHGFAINNRGNVTIKWIEGPRLKKEDLNFSSVGVDCSCLNFKFPKSNYEYILEVLLKLISVDDLNKNSYDATMHIKMYYSEKHFWIMNPKDKKVYKIRSLIDFSSNELNLII